MAKGLEDRGIESDIHRFGGIPFGKGTALSAVVLFPQLRHFLNDKKV